MDLLTEEIPNHLYEKQNGLFSWNSFLATGMPHYANPQSYSFDPLHLVSLLFPGVWGFQAFIAVHYILGPLGVWFLLRRFAFRKETCLALSLLYALSGPFQSAGSLPTVLGALTYAPWFLKSALDLLCPASKPSTLLPRSGLWLSLWTLCLALAGEPQIAALLVVLSLLIAFIFQQRPHRQNLASFLLFLLLGLLGAAPQILPFLEFLLHSNRSGEMSVDSAMRWSQQPLGLLNLILPHVHVDPEGSAAWGLGYWEKELPYLRSVFVGGFAVLAAALGLIRGANEKSRTGLFLTIVALLFLVLGIHTPIGRFAYSMVPGLTQFRFPQKWMLILFFLLLVPAARGMEILLRNPAKAILQKAAVGVMLLALIGISAGITLAPSENASVDSSLTYWTRYAPLSIFQSALFMSLILAALGWIRKSEIRFVTALGLAILELILVHWNLNPSLSTSSLSQFPAGARYLRELDPHGLSRHVHTDAFRKSPRKIGRFDSLPASYTFYHETLTPPSAIAYGRSDIGAHYSLYPETLDQFHAAHWSTPLPHALALYGVRWLLIPQGEVIPPGFRFAASVANLTIAEHPDAPSTIYFPRSIRLMNVDSSRKEIVAELNQVNFDPNQEVVLTAREETRAPAFETPPRVLEVSRSPRSVRINLQDPSIALLVWRETFHSDWQAAANGVHTPIVPVDGRFMGIWIDQNTKTVEFRFVHRALIWGFGLSLMAAIVAILVYQKNTGSTRRS